jgi:hypothetical protein
LCLLNAHSLQSILANDWSIDRIDCSIVYWFLNSWKRSSSSTRGFSCTLLKTNCDSYTCQKTQNAVCRKVLSCLRWWHCLNYSHSAECRTTRMSFVQIQRTFPDSPIIQSSVKKWIKRTVSAHRKNVTGLDCHRLPGGKLICCWLIQIRGTRSMLKQKSTRIPQTSEEGAEWDHVCGFQRNLLHIMIFTLI